MKIKPDSRIKINSKNIWIILPAYNEGRVIGQVIADIRNEGYKNIIVVDDFSKDDTLGIAKKAGAHAIRHVINRGAGAATKTGIDYALNENAAVIVTMDSDGQHLPLDIKKLVEPIMHDGLDVVIGSRLINPEGMPWIRRVANRMGNLSTHILFGINVTDSQSGFKAFSRMAAEKIQIRTNRYEFCSEVLHEIKKNRLRFAEVPIKVIYTDYSMTKGHGQGIINGIKTLAKLILKKLLD